jgi:uncharacterized protein (DUF58 family)
LRKYFRASKSRSNQAARARKTRFLRRIFPFSFRITREGLLYLAGVLILSLAAINTGNNLLFMILAALLSTIAVSGIVSRNSLKQVFLSMQVPENVSVGERVSIKLSMTNLKRIFPSFSLRVEDPELSRQDSPSGVWGPAFAKQENGSSTNEALDCAMLRQAAYFPILRPGETRSELTVQSFPHRGLYTLEGFWLSTRFPFGFFRRGERVDAKGEVLVYPLVQEISSFFQVLPFLPGSLDGSNLVGPGENLFSIRKYQEGESARIINWKATAKTGELMALEYARDEESKFCLILDTRISVGDPAERHERFERAVSLAASIAAHFLKDGAALEFLTPQEYVPRGTGIDHLYRILRSLAVVQYESTTSAPEPSWGRESFSVIGGRQDIDQILSDKVFKIIITSKPRGSFPSAIWRSSHVVFFDEL